MYFLNKSLFSCYLLNLIFFRMIDYLFKIKQEKIGYVFSNFSIYISGIFLIFMNLIEFIFELK